MANNPPPTGLQPHIIGHVGPPNPIPPMPIQFRPPIPPPPQQFVPVAPQQFQPGGHVNMGRLPPPPPPPVQYPPAVLPQPLPPRSSLAGHALPQAPPPPPAPAQPQIPNSFMPGFGGPRNSNVPYNGGQPMSHQDAPNFSAGVMPWYPPGNQNIQSVISAQQGVEQNAIGHAWFPSGAQSIKPVTSLAQSVEQNVGSFPNGIQLAQSGTTPSLQTKEQSTAVGMTVKPETAKTPPCDWIEHTPRHGKKYYYNKRTKVSSWEKPLELMTPTERADASTDWREYTSPEGRSYYYNKVTKQSKWTMPEEVKLAREGAREAIDVKLSVPASVPVSGTESSTPNANILPSSVTREMVPSPISATPSANSELMVLPGSSSVRGEVSNLKSDATRQQTPPEIGSSSKAVSDTPAPVAMTPSLRIPTVSPQDAGPPVKPSPGSVEETTRNAGISVTGDIGVPEGGDGKKGDHEPVYESKEEAKKAFKALLESANVGSDWNWEQAMRVIINDRRYGALRTLGERKQAFNEFVGQKRKQESEEKRARQKKARENFRKMLHESKDLTSVSRWSKVVSIFEKDDRFHAVERSRDREDLFEDHLEELKKKERAKAVEEHKRHQAEYLEFLKSCDFIKASSQWRKVQHRLEADERCSRLEKIERLEIFQEYTRELELQEEEHRKLRMEEQRKAERRNRDDFRKLMEEHVAYGILTTNSHWRDYCMKVKDEPAYLAVSSNTSGSTAKDLFDDVIEDLEKKYQDDKERVEEAVKNERISLSTAWTFEDFKGALTKERSLKSISDVNLKTIFDELMEIAKEREEKESKKRKRLADDVYEFLYNYKDITSSTKWEECKPHVEERFVGDEIFFQEIFDRVIFDLKEKAKERKRKEEKAKKEKERKDKEKKKEKGRKRKDRGYEKKRNKDRHKIEEMKSNESESDSYGYEESKRSRDRHSKHHQKRGMTSYEDTSLEDDEKDHSRSHRHSSDYRKSKQMERPSWTGDADSENQNNRYKRGHWDMGAGKISVTNWDEEGEDGEVM